MQCPRCQHENRLQAKFCEECAAPFAGASLSIESRRDLPTEIESLRRALTAARQQQLATTHILGGIARSPTDLQPVFDAIVAHAGPLCGGIHAIVIRFDGNTITLAAHNAPSAEAHEHVSRMFPCQLDAVSSGVRRALVDGQVVQEPDIEGDAEYPATAREAAQIWGYRARLVVPMVRAGRPIGAIAVGRSPAGAFSGHEVALLQTFADQAVIAIENVRLFQELEARNRELTEALKQQTATGEILRVIASSPTDLRPVMEAVAENATRVCGATDSMILRLEGKHLHVVAMHGSLRRALAIGDTFPVSRDTVSGRAVCDRRTIHVEDILAAKAEFPVTVSTNTRAGSLSRTMLATPLLREGTPLGAILIARGEAHPFSAKQIALLETFANQVVIAIENVRLLQELEARNRELTETLEQQTATAEILRVISSAPTDLASVMEAVIKSAARLTRADHALIGEAAEGRIRWLATSGFPLLYESVPISRQLPSGRAILDCQTTQVEDMTKLTADFPSVRRAHDELGVRTILATPLVREGLAIGVLLVRRTTVAPFSGTEIELLRTFADQAVIAIENVRLFKELADKSHQLEAASRHKSEFLANMSHELRTPLNAIIGFSEVLAERMFGEVNEKQAEYLQDILSSGQHLLSLINDILDLSKVEAGRLELELGRFHLPTALENALTLVRERATRHGITLTQTVEAGVGDIIADERKVKQILLNLLSNAVKFTPEGGQVRLTASAVEGLVIIAVSDTGIGIAPEDQAAIFEEFRQVGRDDARKQEGTGLGLTLAKKFVELHAGRIWVQSHVGQGSTFTFTLPVRLEVPTT
jgi:signal transduction histidine kinase